jgi:hypothetical protein
MTLPASGRQRYFQCRCQSVCVGLALRAEARSAFFRLLTAFDVMGHALGFVLIDVLRDVITINYIRLVGQASEVFELRGRGKWG